VVVSRLSTSLRPPRGRTSQPRTLRTTPCRAEAPATPAGVLAVGSVSLEDVDDVDVDRLRHVRTDDVVPAKRGLRPREAETRAPRRRDSGTSRSRTTSDSSMRSRIAIDTVLRRVAIVARTNDEARLLLEARRHEDVGVALAIGDVEDGRTGSGEPGLGDVDSGDLWPTRGSSADVACRRVAVACCGAGSPRVSSRGGGTTRACRPAASGEAGNRPCTRNERVADVPENVGSAKCVAVTLRCHFAMLPFRDSVRLTVQ